MRTKPRFSFYFFLWQTIAIVVVVIIAVVIVIVVVVLLFRSFSIYFATIFYCPFFFAFLVNKDERSETEKKYRMQWNENEETKEHLCIQYLCLLKISYAEIWVCVFICLISFLFCSLFVCVKYCCY